MTISVKKVPLLGEGLRHLMSVEGGKISFIPSAEPSVYTHINNIK